MPSKIHEKNDSVTVDFLYLRVGCWQELIDKNKSELMAVVELSTTAFCFDGHFSFYMCWHRQRETLTDICRFHMMVTDGECPFDVPAWSGYNHF